MELVSKKKDIMAKDTKYIKWNGSSGIEVVISLLKKFQSKKL